MEDLFNDYLDITSRGKLYRNAQMRRLNPTEAEELLWERLQSKRLYGLKFRRQHPLRKYIVDFYCHEKRLVIELDEGVDDSKERKMKDPERTDLLNKLNITEVWFSNLEVLNDIWAIEDKIMAIVETLPKKR